MKSSEVRKKFIDFYVKRGHTEIPSAPLVPENDPTTLFTSSGMQPLIPYLLGQKHPSGQRLVDSQKSFRAGDIEEVGDNRHTTFFEMLGNWSLGDYFKKEQLPWIFTFLTSELGLDPKRLYVSVFEGEGAIPKDDESIAIWKELFKGVGIEAAVGERIFTYPAKKNWWSRSGEPEKMPEGEPGGPDSEVFFDFGASRGLHENSPFKNEACHPNCDCGRFMEIANSVFMQYQKQADGTLKELAQKNVDFGGGLERMVSATNNEPDVFKIDILKNIILAIENSTGRKYEEDSDVTKTMRIISDHIRSVTMMLLDGVHFSNKGQGYIARRLIRRAAIKFKSLDSGITEHHLVNAAEVVLKEYNNIYCNYEQDKELVSTEIGAEVFKFTKALEGGLSQMEKGLKELESEVGEMSNKAGWTATGKNAAQKAFYYYQTFGLPIDVYIERFKQAFPGFFDSFGELEELNKEFDRLRAEHIEKSRTASAGMFKGGLADHSEATTKLHTAHHLLLASLQKIVDPAIKQRGSNITAERLRMDFNFARKLTPEELTKVEAMVNDQIAKNFPVTRVEMAREDAEKVGAQMEFGHKYPDKVSIYFVGLTPGKTPENARNDDYFSAEFCGGPHVGFTGALGHFTIQKEESAGAGIRRIYAKLT